MDEVNKKFDEIIKQIVLCENRMREYTLVKIEEARRLCEICLTKDDLEMLNLEEKEDA